MCPTYTSPIVLNKKEFLLLFITIIPLLIFSQAPVSQTFNSSGTWTIAAGSGYHANVTVQVWGGGGGGAASAPSGGGGGGGYASTNYPGLGAGIYTITVGKGGSGGSGSTSGGTGGTSSFTGTSITQTLAVGGTGGGPAGGAGPGGLAGSGTGTVKRAGGDGGVRSVNAGGGGAGTATSSSFSVDGGNGSGTTGGAGGGGIGGNGGDKTGSPDAQPGNAPGGGGGGRGLDAGTSKSGGDGRVIVTVITLLPIQLTSFYITQSKNPILHWTTLSELDNNHFTIEQSCDGIHFNEIAKISGHGTTDKKTDYSFIDFNPISGINYYKLNQVDIDNSVSDFIIQTVTIKSSDITVYPTITRDQVNLHLPYSDQDSRWMISNSSGVKYNEGVIKQGKSFDQLSLSGVPSGTYFLTIASKNKMQSFKLLKM
jgi:hypothetical protein